MKPENLSIQNQINDFVKLNPSHAMPVLKKLGIDLCCGGAKTLQVVCGEKGLDPNEVLRQLNQQPN